MSVTRTATTRELASFLSRLRFEDLPDEVVERTKELFLDWAASALAGKNARPVRILERFTETMGPAEGPSEILVSRQRTSPLLAALVNGAASHVVEQDDLHNASVFHPATVVFPAALAAAQQTGASGQDLISASVAGYETGVRVGSYLGRSHYKVFHTTGTAGTLAAAAAVSHLLGTDEEVMLHALGSAGTQAAGLWEFLRDAADSKQLHTAKAASDGLLAAYLARDGFTGATRILEGDQGLAVGMSSDALLEAMGEHGLGADQIAGVRACVHGAAIDVLGPVSDPRTIHQSKFSMGFVLAMIATTGSAGIDDFTEEALEDPALRGFSERVEMIFDPEIDAAYPQRWIGLVEIETTGGEHITSRVDVPKGDPGNTLSREELEEKARSLAAFQSGASDAEMDRIIGRVWSLDLEPDVRNLLPEA